ncbi:unnamed protein product [Schistosoma margrebowiei]|uniref:Uncharacterized protein n=1 Tax=Schistosoma margrebowiei TaxID=48269 RepID=A0A183MME2_9TREM|nr:unnamed protein product [Schistosoma margrebowiei]
MVVGGSRQETLNSGFLLLGTRQQGVPVILRELTFFCSSVDCDLARIRLHSVITLVTWHDLGIISIPRDRQQIHLGYSHQLPSDIWPTEDLIG